MKLDYRADAVLYAKGQLKTTYPVSDARQIGDHILVLYDYMAFPKSENLGNLFAYGVNGALLWQAQSIGADSTDAYTHILSEQPLIVSSFSGFACSIDLQSGQVVSKSFAK